MADDGRNAKKLRGKKTATGQMEMLITFISENNILLTGKCHPNNMNAVEEKWDELVEKLNNIPGARKDKKQWKSFFSEWKSKARKKARLHKNSMIKTGGGGYICKDFTDLENRLLRAVGWISITGCEDLPDEIDPEEKETEQSAVIWQEAQSIPPGEYELGEDGVAKYVGEASNDEGNLLQCGSPTQSEEEPGFKQNQNKPTYNNDGFLPKIPVFVPKKKTFKHKKKILPTSKMSQLEKSAEMYAESSKMVAESVGAMAKSIHALARSITTIANALVKVYGNSNE